MIVRTHATADPRSSPPIRPGHLHANNALQSWAPLLVEDRQYPSIVLTLLGFGKRREPIPPLFRRQRKIARKHVRHWVSDAGGCVACGQSPSLTRALALA